MSGATISERHNRVFRKLIEEKCFILFPAFSAKFIEIWYQIKILGNGRSLEATQNELLVMLRFAIFNPFLHPEYELGGRCYLYKFDLHPTRYIALLPII